MPAKTPTMTAAEFRSSLQKPAAGTSVPAAGPVSIPAKKRNTDQTNSLTKAIISLLTLEGCKAWRQNNAAVYDASFGGYRQGSTVDGISDVMGYHRSTGRVVAVEVKVGKDTLSKEQEDFLEEVRHAGGFACEGRSLDQVRREFHEWKATLKK